MTFLSFLIDCVLIGKIRYSNIIFSPAPQGGGGGWWFVHVLVFSLRLNNVIMCP